MWVSVQSIFISLFVLLLVGCQSEASLTQRSEIRLQLGLHYLAVDDYPAAERNLLKALQVNTQDYRITLALAKVHQRQKNHPLTEQWYQRALQQVPKNGYVLNNYGAFLCTLRQYDKAQHLFLLAEQANERGVRNEALLQSGYCFLENGYRDLAQKKLTDVRLNSSAIKADWLTQTKRWIDRQHWGNAELLLALFHQQHSPTAESLWFLVYVAAQQGNTAAVKRYGERLARIFPHSIQYQRYIANEY